MHVEGIDPVAVYAALMPTLVRTVFAQPDAASAWAQHARVVDQLAGRFPAAAELLADAGADLLAFTAFPAETGARPGPTIPVAGEQRARRACLPTGGVLLQQDHIGPGSSRFPLWASVATGRTSIAPQPGRQEIASSNYLRFWYLSISLSWRSLWASSRAFKFLKYAASGFIHLAPAATGISPSDTIIVIFDRFQERPARRYGSPTGTP